VLRLPARSNLSTRDLKFSRDSFIANLLPTLGLIKASCMAAFPFQKGTAPDSIQRHVVEKVYASDFVFELPLLSDTAWSSICNNSAERDRLEFVGDALMSGAVSEELYRIRLQGSPGFYTVGFFSTYSLPLIYIKQITLERAKCSNCQFHFCSSYAQARPPRYTRCSQACW
jgi:hypothetical protein